MERFLIWFVAVGLVAAAITAVVGLSIGDTGAGANADFAALAPETLVSVRWGKGNEAAKVILTEFSDFQCPACAVYNPIIKRVVEEFGDRILFSYRHFPLKEIHRNAEIAAKAAEAAGLQGKFWEMHDALFENQPLWSDSSNARSMFLIYAQTIGLDAAKFKRDLDSKEVAEKVSSDYRAGFALEVYGTPTFFVNGVKLTPNPRSYDEFKSILEAAIEQAS
jgi:protein-disulfide isomerase